MVRKNFENFGPFLETLGLSDFPKSAQNTPRVGQLPKKFYVTTIPISQGNFWAKVQTAGSWFPFWPIWAQNPNFPGGPRIKFCHIYDPP